MILRNLGFIFILVLLLILFVLAIFSLRGSEHETVSLPDNPSNSTYLKAKDLCGEKGIYNIEWRNFEKGEVERISCNWR